MTESLNAGPLTPSPLCGGRAGWGAKFILALAVLLTPALPNAGDEQVRRFPVEEYGKLVLWDNWGGPITMTVGEGGEAPRLISGGREIELLFPFGRRLVVKLPDFVEPKISDGPPYRIELRDPNGRQFVTVVEPGGVLLVDAYTDRPLRLLGPQRETFLELRSPARSYRVDPR